MRTDGTDNEGDVWERTYDASASSEKNAFCFRVWTKGYGLFNHSGYVVFHLAWSIQRSVDDPAWVNDAPINLAWGQRVVFDITPGEWRLEYDPFDEEGAPEEVGSAASLRWLTVTVGPSQADLAVIDPKDVRFR